MLTKIIIAVLCLISIPFALILGAFIQNDLPWTDPPGLNTRLKHYLTTNVAETVDASLYPELIMREYDFPKEHLFSLLKASVTKLGWEIDSERDEKYSLLAVVTTPLRGYKDDILIRLIPISDDRNHLYIRSSSREGHGDLGTNTRHILDLYHQIDMQIASTPSKLLRRSTR
jgi:Protein of unknown function (DUF1499)